MRSTENSFSPWHGCSRKSPGCRFCYADTNEQRWHKDTTLWRRNGERRVVADSTWAQPSSWDRQAAAAGVDQLVFCASMCDVFEEHPQVIDARARLWTVIAQTPHLQWQLLTKRPENVAAMVPWAPGAWPHNVWLGTSVERQQEADERIPLLLATSARIKFLSLEPLLSPVDLTGFLIERRPVTDPELDAPDGAVVDGMERIGDHWTRTAGLDWLIIGGESESAAKARPMQLEWAQDLCAQGARYEVSVFVKQLGRRLALQVGARGVGRRFEDLPESLQVRQFPHGVRRPAVAAAQVADTSDIDRAGAVTA